MFNLFDDSSGKHAGGQYKSWETTDCTQSKSTDVKQGIDLDSLYSRARINAMGDVDGHAIEGFDIGTVPEVTDRFFRIYVENIVKRYLRNK